MQRYNEKNMQEGLLTLLVIPPVMFHLTTISSKNSPFGEENWEYAYNRLKSTPNIHILGGVDANKVERLPILSFLIEVYEDGKRHFLHYNFVCSLLNDLYGIQSRGVSAQGHTHNAFCRCRTAMRKSLRTS